jgi:hypothetical protein
VPAPSPTPRTTATTSSAPTPAARSRRWRRTPPASPRRSPADVGALDAETLASSPPWIDEPTLADEIIQHCATHGMVLDPEPAPVRARVLA